MKFLLPLSMFVFSIASLAQDLDKSLQQAQSEGKAVLLYFSGSDWCIPCMRFTQNVLETDEYRSFAETNLVMCQIDFPQSDESSEEHKSYKRSIAEKYNSSGGFPRMVLLSGLGEILWEETGYKNKEAEYYIDAFQTALGQ